MMVKPDTTGIRPGLCGVFLKQPIRFRHTTAKAMSTLSRQAALIRLSGLCMANAETLLAALKFCARRKIGCFRINGQILPFKTHAEFGYGMADLPEADEIVRRFQQCGEFAGTHHIRTCCYADPHVVLTSPCPEILDQSIRELECQAELAEWVGADVLNIQGGRASGDRSAALVQLATSLSRLSDRVRSCLTVQNDESSFTPSDLLPLCRSEQISLVYNVHHHRCNPDGLSVEAATEQALATWNREPMFQISSPVEGWSGPKPSRHHDFIDVADFPDCWRGLSVTVQVDANAKEVAVLKLMRQLTDRWFVYILRCADGSFYTGITNDPERRLRQHNSGTASRYTRSRLPVDMVYREPQRSHSLALKRELEIKAFSKQKKQGLIQNTNPSPAAAAVREA
jgi:UV DNA damage endonuclease